MTLVLQRGIIALFTLMFTFTAVYVPQTFNTIERAQAQTATAEVGPQLYESIWTRISTEAGNYVRSTIANFSSLQWWKDNVLDKMGWALAKAILSAIMRDIVRWINSGFQGSPAFVQDFGSFVTDVADQTAGRFLQEVGGPLSIVCSPFRLNIQIALAVSYNRTRDKNARRCTLTGALQNIQNFIGGDFSQGGWNSWLQITQNPGQYTQAGSLLEASAEMSLRISSAQGQATIPLDWGRGFLSSKVCDDPQSPGGAPKAPAEPGASQGTQAAQPNCRISTPGDVISSQLNSTLGLGNEALIAADEINEVIGAFMQQMVVQALTGAQGLLGTGGAGARYTNPGFNVDQYTQGMEIGVDYTSARITMNQSYAAALSYLQLAQTTARQYENGYSTDPGVQARADAAYAEVQSLLPALQSNVTTMQSIIAEFDAATTDQARSMVLSKFTNIVSSIPSQDIVSGQQARWGYAMSGLSPRDSGTVDRRAMVEQVAIEREYLNLINAAIDAYEAIGSPNTAETTAYNEAQKVLPTVQDNIITVQDLIGQYDTGNTDNALSGYNSLRADLSTEADIDSARADWETVFGPLP